MAERLVDRYQPGDTVEIKLREGEWKTAVVLAHQFPGIWVRIVTGEAFYVTNTRHIRPAQDQNQD